MLIEIRRDDSPLLREHCVRYHYLHRYPDPRSLPFGYRLMCCGEELAEDGRLFGLVVFKKPQHHKQLGLFGFPGLPTAWQVLDLARVWIHPELQVPGLNIFSQMVGRAIRRVQGDWLVHHAPVFPHLPYHIRVVISYCELAHHDGTAYRASGFTRFGTTVDGTKELYVRFLKQPYKSWKPTTEVQYPLFSELPLVHRKGWDSDGTR